MHDRNFPAGGKTNRIASGTVRIHIGNRKSRCMAGPVQVETARLYPTRASQCALNSAAQVRQGRAKLLGAAAEAIEQDHQNCGYAIRICIFYRVTAKALVGIARPVEICGLGVSRKWVIIGKRLSAVTKGVPEKSPHLAVKPGWIAVLRLELKECCEESRKGNEVSNIPPCICDLFNNDLYFGREGRRLFLQICRYPGRAS